MRKVILTTASAVAVALLSPASAWAMISPTVGQPGAPANTCGDQNPVTPGASANAAGSPFNATGTAGGVYAGNPGTASLTHANSVVAVSQYDVACVQLSH